MQQLQPAGFHFYEGGRKWVARGLTYGPFRPNHEGAQFPSGEPLERDMEALANLGANCVRLYTPPSPEVATAAHRHGLRLLVDVPWPKHIDVYGNPHLEKMALRTLDEALDKTVDSPNLMGLLLGNEIPPDLVRWAGPQRVERFLKSLYHHAKTRCPHVPVGFANFPSTEYLLPPFFDFMGFNVYLSDRAALRSYLVRLRNLLPEMPLVLTETGEDSLSKGERKQGQRIYEALEEAYDTGFAGAFVFSWTDEWHTGGYDINDWAFGIVDKERRPKRAFYQLKEVFEKAPRSRQLAHTPSVTIVVATYNGGRTLRKCLESLRHLNYPDYETVVVDDGSTDDTQDIVKDFPEVRTTRQENAGLSSARNEGIRLARGEIVAFTDSDCEADPDWLHHLAGPFENPHCAGAGGPNLTPGTPSRVHRAVSLAPGHAAHVLLDSERAEHVPGCNMAFRREKLLEVDAFDPLFRQAGDDVDIIWRLQDLGYTIAFAPGALVWHHRRSTLRAYWRQQAGYGRAEALLIRKHPHRFNDRGQSLWRGTIYTDTESEPLLAGPNIHYGVFATSGYQCIYTKRQAFLEHFAVSLEWWLLSAALLLAGWFSTPALVAGLAAVALSLSISGIKAWRKFSRRRTLPVFWFLLVWFLWVSQPIVRTASRMMARTRGRRPDLQFAGLLDRLERGKRRKLLGNTVRQYWTEGGVDRLQFLRNMVREMKNMGWMYTPNTGWEPWDISVGVTWAHRVLIVTAAEDHGAGKILLKVRLRLVATSLFWLALAGVLLSCGLLAFYDTVAARLVFLAFVLAGWYFYRQALIRRAAIGLWVDKMASDTEYFNISEEEKKEKLPDTATEPEPAAAFATTGAANHHRKGETP